MNTQPPAETEAPHLLTDAFDLDDCEDIVGMAKHLIDGHHPGILSTVDAAGRPHLRWMSTLAFDDFPNLYTLTSPNSRKLVHLAERPLVSWMFSNEDLSMVLTLSGPAKVLYDKRDRARIWKLVEDKSHAYFLNNFGNKPEYVVLQTTVDEIECTLPRNNFRWSMDTRDLTPKL